MPRSEALDYLARLGKQATALGEMLDRRLVDEGCASYVKTIYIGYEIGGEMVAALYGHQSYIELALALAEDDNAPGLKDASHLTWRTLPVAVELRSEADLAAARDLIQRACERVRSGVHGVRRDNDHFARAREARRCGS